MRIRPHSTIEDIANAFENATRDMEADGVTFKHKYKGGPTSPPTPTVVGRAVEKDTFIRALSMHNLKTHHFSRDAEIRDFVSRLMRGTTLTPSEEAILMNEFAAWVTWDEEHGSADPFAFARGTSVSLGRGTSVAETVRACLGLDPEKRRARIPLLLLIYQLPPGLELYRPTVADAGAYYLFEPPSLNTKHGMTKPWPRGLCVKASVLEPRPEAVHRPAPMVHLTQPIEAHV